MKSIQVPAAGTRKEKYEALLPQIFGMIEGERDLIANLANISAALKEGMGFFWVGFYIVKKSLSLAPKRKGETPSPGELVLGPFQGPVACTRIPYGKGVCGLAWAKKKAIIVPDVREFPGHIVCSPVSRSEIVVPLFLHPDLEGEEREVLAVLDIDSDQLNDFSEVDEYHLTRLLQKVTW